MILEPHLALPEIMRWLKGRTGRKANQILGRRGQGFWQDESYDHWVRTTKELNDLIRYVENNPVQAALVAEEAQWPWSSARMRADDTLPEADDELRSSAPPPLRRALRDPVRHHLFERPGPVTREKFSFGAGFPEGAAERLVEEQGVVAKTVWPARLIDDPAFHHPAERAEQASPFGEGDHADELRGTILDSRQSLP